MVVVMVVVVIVYSVAVVMLCGLISRVHRTTYGLQSVFLCFLFCGGLMT